MFINRTTVISKPTTPNMFWSVCAQNFLVWSVTTALLNSFLQSWFLCASTCAPAVWELCTGISFIDSTALAVCKNPRIHSHKVFAGLAERGKTSTGWFFGFKLHLIFNDRGELLNLILTPGNVDDRKPVPKLVRKLFGKVFGDKGYLSKALRDELFRTFSVQLVTGVRSNMKNVLMPLMDKILLRKRAIVETIIDQLKNISQIEHSRHRSPVNFLVNLLCGLIAYCRRPKKPSLGLGTLPALVA